MRTNKHVESDCKQCLKPEDQICRIYTANMRLCLAYKMASRTPKRRIQENLFVEDLQTASSETPDRSSRPEVICEKGVLRNFAKFTGKHLCQSLFFNKVAGGRLQIY